MQTTMTQGPANPPPLERHQRPKRKRDRREVEYLLEAWARWKLVNHGYPGRSPASAERIRMAMLGSPFCSRPPARIDPPGCVRPLLIAMEIAQGAGAGEALEAVVAWYLRRPGETWHEVARQLGCSRSEAVIRRNTGEVVLQSVLDAVNSGKTSVSTENF